MKHRLWQSGRGLLLLCLGLFTFASLSEGSVLVYDDLTTPGHSITLVTKVKGLLGPRGGERITFLVGGRTLCKGLTGFDGFGYCEFRPAKKGVLKIIVQTKEESGQGLLYVLSPGRKVFVFEIDSLKGSILPFILSVEGLEEARRSLELIVKRFALVYISASVGFYEAKRLIKEAELPEGPVFEYQAGLFTELQRRRVNLYGILCSGLCAEARESFKKVFSFEEMQGVKVIDDWDALLKDLKISHLRTKGP